jgi:hypothetical protein
MGDIRAFGGPKIQPFRDPANSAGGLGLRPRRNLDFGWISFQAQLQIGRIPSQALGFFCDHSFGFGCGALNFHLAR